MSGSSPPVVSDQGIVVSPHYLASQVGADILRAGGNAVDAAIATQAALGVVYPHMTGVGGDAFWLIYDQPTHSLRGLNGSGRAAAAAQPEFYQRQGLSAIPERGPLGVLTVPGAVDSWGKAHQRFGKLDWAALLQPAISLARRGYPMSSSQAYWTRRDRPIFQRYSPQSCPFLPSGRLPKARAVVTNPDLGNTLQCLAEAGPASFYQGAIADQIAQHLAGIGGLLTTADLAQHQSNWCTPIETRYRGYRIAQMPPNSQGFVLLQMLNLIEAFDLTTWGEGTADYYHLMVEATKLAFKDRDRWLTDPNFVDIPLAELIDKRYSDQQRQHLSREAAGVSHPPTIGGDTVYTAVTDPAGNAVSVIQSVYFDYGSAVIVPGTGFVLQNRGCFFSLEAAHSNVLTPHKRTFHTLMPGMVLSADGSPHLVLGTMGGEGQPQTQLALLTRLLDFGFMPQAAVDAPRWRWGRTWGERETKLALERRIPQPVRQQLQTLGHSLKVEPDWTEKMGHAHVIRCSGDGSRYEGGCDPRSDGAAVAL